MNFGSSGGLLRTGSGPVHSNSVDESRLTTLWGHLNLQSRSTIFVKTYSMCQNVEEPTRLPFDQVFESSFLFSCCCFCFCIDEDHPFWVVGGFRVDWEFVGTQDTGVGHKSTLGVLKHLEDLFLFLIQLKGCSFYFQSWENSTTILVLRTTEISFYKQSLQNDVQY